MSSKEDDHAKLLKCLDVLYGSSCPDPSLIQEANTWLISFQQKDDAFPICISILKQSLVSQLSPPLLFYAAHSILLFKRHRSKSLHSQGNSQEHIFHEEQELIQLVLQFLSCYSSKDYQSIRYKLFQSLASQWMYSVIPFDQYYQQFVQFCIQVQNITLETISSVSENNLILVLGVLEMIPEEIDRSSLSLKERDAMNSFIRKQKDFLLDLCSLCMHNSFPVSVRISSILCLKSLNHWLIGSRYHIIFLDYLSFIFIILI